VPLRAEPFGLVVLEAAYYKKGIVATRVGGIPEIVTDDVSALLVDADDHVGMSAKMARLLRDPDLAGRLGAGAVAPAAFDEAAVSETSSRATTTARR
jgi:glycosyltransferase involved in cell wall biosynthesis